ncbi:zinc-binding alcohol dehydrogenase [Microterricola pindariensis]|uniref:Zinc-binding alcohol dehydrogenase n=1 Tax=Microterricola pindariensis TaxID=478010 RepID=A0ABX5AX04_9MICO|nr:zinc-binding alcohol dehydrogenase [Microterricola pindariensis]PPL19085.1 hypothetical protein GY24_08010 [Microterricola pindariensis]
MWGSGAAWWSVREEASRQVLLALYLRDRIGIEAPVELPRLQGVIGVSDGTALRELRHPLHHGLLRQPQHSALTPPPADAQPAAPLPFELIPEPERSRLETQWLLWWASTVEPERYPSPIPLELAPGFGDLVALPVRGAELLLEAITPYAEAAVAWSDAAARRFADYQHEPRGSLKLAYAGLIAENERVHGRRARVFELTVQLLPLAASGAWWIGRTSVAITDTLRTDPTGFTEALRPIIAELA